MNKKFLLTSSKTSGKKESESGTVTGVRERRKRPQEDAVEGRRKSGAQQAILSVKEKRYCMQSWHEYGAGGLVAASVYSPDEQVGERLAYSYEPFATGTTVYAYHDQLGSVRRWRLANKNNWGANEYQAFGKAYNVSTLAPQDYALHEWDTNLAMFRAPYRNYRPDMLRWINRDPAGMVDGPNVYGYISGNPINNIDYSGLFGCCLENGDKAFSDAAKKYNGGFESWMDHMRHCTASCELTKSSGEGCAALADLREYSGMVTPKKIKNKYGKYISDGSLFDLVSNQMGRDCGSILSAINCDACCRN